MTFGSLIAAFFVCLFSAMIFMSGMFVIAKRMRRFDFVDVTWGLVFIVIAFVAWLHAGAVSAVSVITVLLVGTWGLRLSSHIYRRLRATLVEDKRYVELRQRWRSQNENLAIFLRIFMTQAVLATVISLPVIIGVSSHPQASSLVIVGSIIWIIGFGVESVADRQLRHFIHDTTNKGQLMTRGLWRYSRHPNYFGELVMWWGIGVMALGAPLGWVGLVGPVLISYLIIFVSGIPPTEKAFAGRQGWNEYKHRTSVLIPWFVNKGRLS